IIETDKVIHTVDTDIVKLVVEIESFDMSSDEFDKETGSSDEFEITKLCLLFYLGKDEDEEELMVDWLSIIETDKVVHTVKNDIVKLVVEIESFGMSSDEFDKESGSSDGLESKQVDLSCVHALNELYLHEIHDVPSKHVADQCGRLSAPERIALSARVVIEKFLIRRVANSVDKEKLPIRLNWEAANPVEAEKLRIRLNFEAANPVETEKLRIRLNFEAANSVETENLRIRLSL
ncbi:hypothetical protein Tco_1084053, partial [Tanacetum coccineum]